MTHTTDTQRGADGGAGLTARGLAAGSVDASASKLRRVRQQHCLSQRRVAWAVGIAYSYLSAVERGDSRPTVDVAIRLARFYETTVEELFGEGDGIGEA